MRRRFPKIPAHWVVVEGDTYPVKNELKHHCAALWNPDCKKWFVDPADADKAAKIVAGETPAPVKARSEKPVTKTTQDATTVYGNEARFLSAFGKTPTVFAGFRSLRDMADFVDDIPSSISMDDRSSRGRAWRRNEVEFFGTPSMTAALRLARDGWPEGVEIARQVSDLLTTQAPQRRRNRMAVAGGHAVVGRMLAGDPLHMVQRAASPSRKVITLLSNTGASCGISEEDMTIRAAIVAAIADNLEQNGYSCEIVAVQRTTYENTLVEIATTLKHAGERLNLSDIVFGLGHPSMHRRFNFAVFAVDESLRSMWRNMGYPKSVETEQPNTFVIPHIKKNYSGSLQNKIEQMLPNLLIEGLPVSLR